MPAASSAEILSYNSEESSSPTLDSSLLNTTRRGLSVRRPNPDRVVRLSSSGGRERRGRSRDRKSKDATSP